MKVMIRLLGPAAVLLVMGAVIVGIVCPTSGAAAVVYCSAVGGGILLGVLGAMILAVHALRAVEHPRSCPQR